MFPAHARNAQISKEEKNFFFFHFNVNADSRSPPIVQKKIKIKKYAKMLINWLLLASVLKCKMEMKINMNLMNSMGDDGSYH